MVEIDKIQEYWAKDCLIDNTELGRESLKVPELFNKYLKIYTNEKLLLVKINSEYQTLKKEKWEYYLGKSTVPHPTKVMRQDIDIYLDADSELVKKKNYREYQREKLLMLEKILKSIEIRGFSIKNALDWIKFIAGG